MESQRPARLPPSGLPILSGPPPITESSTCRQCGKEFNLLWRRKHACGHCGYEYCSNCLSDGQALMPRRPGQARAGSSSNQSGPAALLAEIKEGLGIDDKKESGGSGYEVESVCLYCLSMLQVTAASLVQLRSLPIKRLKDYLAAYNIPCIGPKEKEDFVQAVIRARDPATGCLPPDAESYFRRRSVPKVGQAPSSAPSSSSSTPRPRPPPPTQARPPPPNNAYYAHARPPPQTYARPPPPSYAYARPAAPPAQARPPPPRATPAPAPAPAPAARASPAPPRQPSPPVPTILSLVSLPKSYLSSLSIGTLKAILYENHVRVDFKQVLEKDQLIDRVNELVTDERKRLERQRIEEERQANGEAQAQSVPIPQANGDKTEEDGGVEGEGAGEGAGKKVPVPTGPMPEIERGLCVVCQDEEATLAVVDCGHLCMCAHCSDLIMATSKECPLCRTRIVTSRRLIRIYRT